MAPPLADLPKGRVGELERRLASALVAAPLTLLLVHVGHPWFDLLILAAMGIGAVEWARLCGGGRIGPAGWLLVAGPLAAAIIAASGFYGVGLAVALGVALMVLAAGYQLRHPSPLWLAAGGLYLAAPAAALLWLRYEPAAGPDLVIWLFLVVWAADSGAYAAGRLLGGPKLAPWISPGKTWAGLFGGLAAAGLTAILAGLLFDLEGLAAAGLAGILLALATAAGDLVESIAKRHFSVKDTGHLIPGHGGLLDRIDGLLIAAPTACGLWIAGWRWV
jgi:phosphatidate cytidylyltransferase